MTLERVAATREALTAAHQTWLAARVTLAHARNEQWLGDNRTRGTSASVTEATTAESLAFATLLEAARAYDEARAEFAREPEPDWMTIPVLEEAT